jgi:SIKE family
LVCFKEISSKISQICDMADVMRSAVGVDSAAETADTERLTRLQMENATLRELLTVGSQSLASPVGTRGTQTDVGQAGEAATASSDDGDWSESVSSAVVYTAQSLLPHVARRYGSHRPGHPMDSSSAKTSDGQQESNSDFPLDSLKHFTMAVNRRVNMADDIDDEPSYSSGTATPDLDDLADGGDNVSVHTIGGDVID